MNHSLSDRAGLDEDHLPLPEPPAPPTAQRLKAGELLLVALLVFAIRAAYALYASYTYEDALITLRYAANFAAGEGLVFNPGQRVFGASTPLWVLLLGMLGKLGVGPLLATAKGIGAVA